MRERVKLGSVLLDDGKLLCHGQQGRVYAFNGYIGKVSNHSDYLIDQESIVAKEVDYIARYCPNFCRYLGTFGEEKTIFLEYIRGESLYSYLNRLDRDTILSVVQGVLLGLAIAQRELRFVSYDLHCRNVILSPCPKDLAILYKIGKYSYLIPTFGYYPVIIDYGFARVEKNLDRQCYCNLNFLGKGFMCDRFDPVADPKLFLVSLGAKLEDGILKKFITWNYKNLSIDRKTGWDLNNDIIGELCEKIMGESDLSKTLPRLCLRLILSLVKLPFKKHRYDKLGKLSKIFWHEFAKIEMICSTQSVNIQILKGIVNTAEQVRSDYGSGKGEAVDFFRLNLYEQIDQKIKFGMLKDLHYEKMLCSLLCLSREVEGFLHDKIEELVGRKVKEYALIPVLLADQIARKIGKLCANVFVFPKIRKIYVVDSNTRTSQEILLNDKQVELLYNAPSRKKTEYVLEMI
jgi:hypothetical protein